MGELSSPNPSEFFLHTVDSSGARVILSYCPRCGRFVAGSSDPEILRLAEELHLRFEQRESSATHS